VSPSARRLTAWLVAALIAAWVLPWALPAQAQNRLPVVLTCPVCGETVDAERQVAANALGGTDSDFCQYSAGGQAREVAVVMCPKCFYAHLHDRFERDLSETQRAELELALATLRPSYTTAETVPTWDRYQIASLMAGLLGGGQFLQGDLLLTGAWTARDRVVGFVPRVDGPLDVLINLDEMDTAWREIPDLRTQQMALFDLMRVAHRGGFIERRDAYLAQLDDLPPVPENLLSVRTKVHGWIEIEERYLDKAREHFEAGLAAGEGTAEDQIMYRYLVIDLKRRRGQTEGLRAELDQMLTDPGLPPQVKVAAKNLVEVLKKR
jgi:Uncharacterized protein conserved in bacteria (DUF2225)